MCIPSLASAEGGYDPNAGGYDPMIKEAPEYLKQMDTDNLCVEFGKSLRKEVINTAKLKFHDASLMVIDEVTRRNLQVNNSLITNKSVKIGVLICDMYAALGHPKRQNRTVTSRGVSIQHIYGGGFYVYTNNGFITSWQD